MMWKWAAAVGWASAKRQSVSGDDDYFIRFRVTAGH